MEGKVAKKALPLTSEKGLQNFVYQCSKHLLHVSIIWKKFKNTSQIRSDQSLSRVRLFATP